MSIAERIAPVIEKANRDKAGGAFGRRPFFFWMREAMDRRAAWAAGRSILRAPGRYPDGLSRRDATVECLLCACDVTAL
ncbi:MAG: hypothetical protein D6744_15955 [Planctomycetota bacterium]|nr:MAG: hypothetical protein D6744_15955 [Planctomycetota bacterium]